MTKQSWIDEFVTVLCRELRPDLARTEVRDLAHQQWLIVGKKRPRQAALDWALVNPNSRATASITGSHGSGA